MIIEGVTITADFDCDPAELANYVAYVKERVPNVDSVRVTACADGKVYVSYVAHNEKFERIRRITGYLTGDLNSWNNAKQAEERDRVKHNPKL